MKNIFYIFLILFQFIFSFDINNTDSNDWNQLLGYLPQNICEIDSVLLGNNKFCPCFPHCDSGVITTVEYQDTTNCSVCEAGYSPICNDLNDNHTGTNSINPNNLNNFTEMSICFKINNLNILQAFIDNSTSTFNMNLLDIDSSGIIEPLELGYQAWIDGELTSLKASYIELSGEIPDSIENLNKLDTLHLHDNQLNGIIPNGICDLNNLIWSVDSSLESNAFLYNNEFCPPYPDCGSGIITTEENQDTTECSTSKKTH